MIFVLPLPSSLANIRFVWLAGGVLGSEESTGITQVSDFLLWRIDTTPPASAEELIIYDVDDHSTYALAHYAPSAASAPTASENAAAVWDELLAGHAISGSAGEALTGAGGAADPWLTDLPGSYDAGTAGAIIGAIQSGEVTVLSPVSQTGNKIAVRAGDSWTIPITGLGNITGRQKLWFAVKDSAGVADATARLFIEESAGLVRVNGSTSVTGGDAAITVTNAGAGNVAITVQESVTALLFGSRTWAIKTLTAGGDTLTLASGAFVISKAEISANA